MHRACQNCQDLSWAIEASSFQMKNYMEILSIGIGLALRGPAAAANPRMERQSRGRGMSSVVWEQV